MMRKNVTKLEDLSLKPEIWIKAVNLELSWEILY